MNAPNLNSRPSDTRPVDGKRRMLVGATAIAAGLVGVGAAWWRTQTPEHSPSTPPADGFWTSEFDTPDGGKLAMRALQGHPLLVNFWATWCAPCIEELPLVNDFYRQNRGNGWQVIGLAIDKPAPVQAFLQKTPLDFPIGMAGLSGAELSRGFGNLAGGLPFSVVLGSDGRVAQRKMGRLTPADLAGWLRLK